MRIGIIGAGSVGSALGKRLSEKGHTVLYGSREPSADNGTVSQQIAVADSDIVVTSIPGSAVLATLETIGEDALAGKVILDPSVPMSPEMTLIYPNDSLARIVQARFPNTRVVKTLNTMNVSMMIDPAQKVPDAMVFQSGDDEAAKQTVAELLKDLGWSGDAIFDLGGIETARATEHCLYLFFASFGALKSPTFTVSIAK
jgi:8-hydroxy-5-deazaflavin:NADPH oxidoreductase